MQLKRSLIALALTSTLAACGSDSSTTTTPTTPVETVVDGKGIKGVLTNAIVTVYKFNDDGTQEALTEQELTNANLVTDGEGNYSFTVVDYDGPIKVELSPRPADPDNPENNTTMTCDAPAGCGDTAFGDQIDLSVADNDFKLASISVVDSNSNGEVKMNVSALTHLATALIEADESGINAASVTENSAQIASTFGIIGDITQLEPTVVDDAAAVAVEDNDAELRYGLINAGIMAALFSGEAGSAEILSSKLAEVAADLVENDGKFLPSQDDNEDTFELALDDVWNGMAAATSTAAAAIAADNTLTAQVNLAQLETELVNESIFITSNIDENGFVTIITDVPTEGDAVAKAKAMVDDVRLFSHLFDKETDQGAGIKGQGDEYISLLKYAGVMVKTEADSFELLAQLSDTLADLSLAYDAGTINEAVAAAGVNIATYIDGATGTIIFDEATATGGILFTVDATSGNEKVKLNAAAEFSEDNKSITLTFDGLLESAGAVFTLNEGSFAQVNLDTAASREAFDNDTYEGEIVSGELELTLSLAQKADVPNPITFEGMIKTKLLPVKERGLDERWDWDEQNQQSVTSYGRPEFETFVLPETLSLSGGFSSLEGDLVEATLTVNVNDLADYQAPEFKYIGKEVADVVNFTFSDDLNTIVITEADKVDDEQQSTETRIFTPGSQTGEWTATSSVVTANPEEHYWGTGIERKIITTRFDSGLEEQGILYTRAYITGKAENNFGVKSIQITPIDSDSNGTTDTYSFKMAHTWDSEEYDGSSFATLIDADGNLLTSDGNLHGWDIGIWDIGEFASIEEFMEQNSNQLIANPLTVDNGGELLAQTITNWWDNQRTLTIDELGQVTFFFNEDELADIAAGEFTELNPTAYLTEPLIKDAFSIVVSEDANTVTLESQHRTRTYTVDYTSAGNFVFNRETREDSELVYSDTRTYATKDVSLDVEEVTIFRVNSFDNENYYTFTRVTPVDENDDGTTDYLNRSITYSNYINADGVLTDENGEPLVEFTYYFANSYEEAVLHWSFPFNPFTVTNALDAYKAWIANARGYSLNEYIDGIGSIETTLSAEEVSSLTANSTTTFDAINTQADDNNLLEDEETFLDVNAALILEAILGDYQVKLQLSGERTALENGTFDLGMSYRLPGEDEQRSFNVHYNTEEEGQLYANNFEGVVLVLEEPEEDIEGTQVIGQILVGPTAIVAATIEDRDGLVVIVYSDESTESL